MGYQIEDRRKFKTASIGAGKFVVWEVRSYPFPHRSYCGTFDTRKLATAFVSSKEKACPA